MDSSYSASLLELAPVKRAGFLSIAYGANPDDFKEETPDQILLREFGEGTYIQLANQKIVPIAVVPASIVLGAV